MKRRLVLLSAALAAFCLNLTGSAIAADEEVARCSGSSTTGVSVQTYMSGIECSSDFSLASATPAKVQVLASSSFTGSVGVAFCRDAGDTVCADYSNHSIYIVAGSQIESVERVLPAGDWRLWTWTGHTTVGLPPVRAGCVPYWCLIDSPQSWAVVTPSSGAYEVVVAKALPA